MSKRTRRSELPMLGMLFIAGGFFAGAAVAQPVIHVGEGSGGPSGTATFSVTLSTGGAHVAATENDIAFDSITPVAVRTSAGGNCTVTTTQACSTNADCPILAPPFNHEACVGSPLKCVTSGGSCTTSADCPMVHEPCVNQSGPACNVNPALAKACSNDASKTCTQDSDCAPGTCVGKSGFFTFLPHVCSNEATKTCTADSDCTSPGKCTGACTPGTNCTGIRAIILAVDNLNAIPDGSTLYSCNVAIASGATVPSDHTLTISKESAGEQVCSNDATKTCTKDTDCTSPGTCIQALINEACVSGHCAVTTGQTCTTSANCPSLVTGTNGTIHVVQGGGSYTVCDVDVGSGDNAGQFGNGTVDFFDVLAIFNVESFGGGPAAGTARFSAMDADPADHPPTCGGNGTIDFFDVLACFNLESFGGTTYVRTGTGTSCTSAVKQ
jgi:hypothetical protein